MKIRDIKKARLEHRSVYCIDKDTSDVLRYSVLLILNSMQSLHQNITSQPKNVLIENKNIEDSYGMGMLCNQQNKKRG